MRSAHSSKTCCDQEKKKNPLNTGAVSNNTGSPGGLGQQGGRLHRELCTCPFIQGVCWETKEKDKWCLQKGKGSPKTVI